MGFLRPRLAPKFWGTRDFWFQGHESAGRLFNVLCYVRKNTLNQRAGIVLLRGTDKAPDIAIVLKAPKFSRIPEPVKMGECFAHGKSQLVHVQLTLEHQGHNIGSRLWRSASRRDLCQPVGMM